ncbi:FkbM family methyltransferase [Mycolicibacterium sarraceniae]|nr:FkbM family methyltransferase [Mycolicibacterium sarraceniae]
MAIANPWERSVVLCFVLTCLHVTRAAVMRLRTSKRHVPVLEKLIRTALFLPLYIPAALVLRGAARLNISTTLPRSTQLGFAMMCRITDMIGGYIWIFGEWEPDLTRFIASRLRDGDVFVDVGANAGYYSMLAARSVGSKGSVVAVEASPAMFDDLSANTLADTLGDRIRLVNKAAAATPGTVTVFSGPSHNVGMSTTLPTRGLHAESTVAAMPLDQILTTDEIAATRIIKIDVEGAEPDVLAGMSTLIESLRPDAEIAIELSPQWWPNPHVEPIDVLRPFLSAGFNVYKMTNDYSPWRYLWPNDVKNPTRVHEDYLTKRVARLDLVLSRHNGDSLDI